MKKTAFHGIRIRAISGVVPKAKISNLNGHHFVCDDERAKISKLTGILEYRRAGPATCASDLCQAAAESLFPLADVTPDTIDAILFVSQTPDFRLPSTACLLQHKLGCPVSTIAFDINLGCSGFIFGLYTACSFIQGGGLRRVLLLCGDTQTKLCYEQDKNVCFLLGDAGTATIVESFSDTSDIRMALMTDGGRYDKLIVPAGGSRKPSTESSREISIQADGGKRSLEHVFMDGMEIFNFSVTDVVRTIRDFMDAEDITTEDIDYLVLHQANKFMTDRVARKLKFPQDKVLYSLEVYGNTSSASIPLTIAHHFSKQNPTGRKRCLLSGFGVGLSWGVAEVVFDNLFCPPIGEI